MLAGAGLPAQSPQAAEAPAEARGLPPRAAPSEYLSQVQAGALTLAAEFKGHSVPTLQGPLTTEEYVVVEAGLYGPAGTRVRLSSGDFSLRINGRKPPLEGQPFGLVFASLKDPEYQPPDSGSKKSKGGISTGGGQSQDDGPPVPAKIPVPVQRAMAQRVQRAAFPEGDRALPQAGVLFFQYRGKAAGIKSVELIYNAPSGAVTLPLQP